MVALMRELRMLWLSVRVFYCRASVTRCLDRIRNDQARLAKAFDAYDTAVAELTITEGEKSDAARRLP